ncbi:Structural maintenance of chromosomes protein 6 [Polyrhizophydium stewartii]|uniref:Structural maintenance of chromosomes protein 6 n=1 Tax=Polyrhizophydium stewartii TaxID=2732419 RepID=A0ABR4NCD3_9FUNG
MPRRRTARLDDDSDGGGGGGVPDHGQLDGSDSDGGVHASPGKRTKRSKSAADAGVRAPKRRVLESRDDDEPSRRRRGRSAAASEDPDADDFEDEPSGTGSAIRDQGGSQIDDDQGPDDVADPPAPKSAKHNDNTGLGSIERVELWNFMCHEKLRVDLGPKINFIVGHNGSGKSAVLTALTVALGGKAAFTNRGNKVSELIKEGTDESIISVRIRNRGSDAYKPNVYGDVIIVERRITRDKGNTYKIKNWSDKTVSTRFEDLMAICDHMQIVVDNPMAVLPQDTARMFLANSSSNDKYNFFLKGTQLEKLAADYVAIDEYIDNSTKILRYKKQAIPEMEAAVKRLDDKWKDLEAARQLEMDYNRLENELIWAKIQEQEAHVEDQAKVVQACQVKVEKAEKELDLHQAECDEIAAQAEQVGDELKAAKAISEPLDDERKRLVNKVNASKAQIQSLKQEEIVVSRDIGQYKSQLKRIQEDIEAEMRKLEVDQAAQRDAKVEQIRRLTEQKSELQASYDQLTHERDELDAEDSQLREQQQSLQAKANGESKRAHRIETEMRNIEGQKQSMFIEVEREEYLRVIETLLSTSLSAMIVETTEDMRLMQSIMRELRAEYVPIFKGSSRSIDVRDGEPDQSFLTVNRCIKFTNSVVHAQLVINHNIEKIVLVRNREEGDRITGHGFPRNVSMVATADSYSMGNRLGGFAATSLYRAPHTPSLNKNADYALRRMHEELDAAKRALSDIQPRFDELKDRQHRLAQRRDDLTEVQTNNLGELEEEKKIEEERLRIAMSQVESLKSQRDDAQQHFNDLSMQLREISIEHQKHAPRIKQLGDILVELSSKEAMAKNRFLHYQERIPGYKANLARETEILQQMRESLASNISECEKFSPRISVTMSADTISKQLQNLRIRLREKEKQLGSREKVGKELKAKRDALAQAQLEIQQSEKFLKFLRRSLAQRNSSYEEFKQFISIRARRLFAELIRKRGYRGALQLDHERKELTLKVDVGEAQSRRYSGVGSDSDPKSLSGGEKSFATVCLLLALWESMASPFRALDEFDVFMDAVNRHLAIKLIIENARDAEAQSQYILISPQNASRVKELGPDVRVCKLNDPERGQTRLNFGGASL